MPLGNIKFTDKDVAYFERIEAQINRQLTIEQRAWYIATRDADFSGSEEKMWQEYPSTPEEAFQKSTEGCYYTEQLTKARKENRISTVPMLKVCQSIRFGILAQAMVRQFGFTKGLAKKIGLYDFTKHGRALFVFCALYAKPWLCVG